MTMYVTMTDTFLSGWGKAANKTAKYVIECEDRHQALTIMKNAFKRSEMKRISKATKKPKYNAKTHQVTERKFSDLGGMWIE